MAALDLRKPEEWGWGAAPKYEDLRVPTLVLERTHPCSTEELSPYRFAALMAKRLFDCAW